MTKRGFIIIVLIASIISIFLVAKYVTLVQESRKMQSYKEESEKLRDSIISIKNSYLLVNNINPLVVDAMNNETGMPEKRIYWVIRNCSIPPAGVFVGKLDTVDWKVVDTTFHVILKNEETFNYFSIENDSGKPIEGVVSILLPKLGVFDFAFSEKKNCWWK
ncbi:MAG: hypothetical protein AB7V36_06085 [Bacteroidales bacterium]